jgi:hypothetical protein
MNPEILANSLNHELVRHLQFVSWNLNAPPDRAKVLGEGSVVAAEGEALLGERLARDAGFFRGPEELLSHLSDQMLRAVRLVLDTGIHANGWSREEAIGSAAAGPRAGVRKSDGPRSRHEEDHGTFVLEVRSPSTLRFDGIETVVGAGPRADLA